MHPTRTRALRRVTLAAAAITLAVAAPAVAAQARTTHASPATQGVHGTPATVRPKAAVVGAGDPLSTVDRVADFYGAYTDAVWDGGNDPLSTDLRAHYLTTGFQHKLATWEAANHADGVLRAQDTPQGWQVTADGSGAGHAFTVVRLQWGNPAHPFYSYLKVQSDLATMKISDIEEQ